MHVVSRYFAKRWRRNVNMSSYCDVTKNVYPVTMDTIHHCSILEFGKGHTIQQVVPGITRGMYAILLQQTASKPFWWLSYTNQLNSSLPHKTIHF